MKGVYTREIWRFGRDDEVVILSMARLQAQKQLHVVAVEVEFPVHELGRNDGKTSSRPQQPFTKGTNNLRSVFSSLNSLVYLI